MTLRLGTRGSALARTQAGQIADLITARTGIPTELITVVTRGDTTMASLASLGGSGVFASALREALLAGECELVVHSMKDLPTGEVPGLEIGAVPARVDPSDALCARDGLSLAELPAGALVGTGSPRRTAQLLARRPDLSIRDIRGNVDTRLGFVDSGRLDAVVLAAAGLERLGRADRITERFPLDEAPSAPSQGALAIEVRAATASAPRSAELGRALAAIEDGESHATAAAERAILAEIEAGCAAPIGASARLVGGRLRLRAAIYAVDGAASVTRDADCAAPADPAELLTAAEGLGRGLARELLADGAAEIAPLHDSCGHERRSPHELTAPALGSAPRLPAAGQAATILVPTGGAFGAEAAEALAARGLTAELCPLIEIEPLRDVAALARVESALTELAAGGVDWLLVTSASTAAILAERAPRFGAGTRIAAVGPGTERALLAAGLRVDLVPARDHSAAGLLAALAATPRGSGERMLLLGAAGAAPTLAEGLLALGDTVIDAPLYRTRSVPPAPEVVARLRSGAIGGAFVTSGSVARALAPAFDAAHPQPAGCRLIAIGGPSAAGADALGLRVDGVAAAPSLTDLIDAWFASSATGPNPAGDPA